MVCMWKVVEAAFWRRLRAGVSAIGNIVSFFAFRTREQETPLPPDPESSFLDGLDDRD